VVLRGVPGIDDRAQVGRGVTDVDPRTTRAETLSASPAIFPVPALDRLTRAHPATPAVVFLPAVVVLAVLGVRGMGAAEALGAAATGYVFWTLCEYWGHRGVFHFEPEKGFGAQLHWMIHGVHHDHPNDPRRLVLPPAFAIPLGLLFFGLFVLVLGTPVAWAFAAGFYLGYVIYDTVHFALHHVTPKGRIGRRLRELHMRHHFEDHERGFGVSAPWWDIVFNTRPRRSGTR
jgi:dihydroceramide fatty acyl 2-hydroxylase